MGVPFKAFTKAVIAFLICVISVELILVELSITKAISNPQAWDNGGLETGAFTVIAFDITYGTTPEVGLSEPPVQPDPLYTFKDRS